MRKRGFACLVTAALLVAAVLAVVGCDVEDDTINLRFATFWPDHDFQVDGHREWAQEVKDRVAEETEYEIDIDWFPGEEIAGAGDIYDAVAEGTADIGTTCPSYTPGEFPVTEAFELPGFNNDNALVSSMVIQEAYETYEPLQEEYEEVEVMHFWATGPGDIITKDPVISLEDLEGMDIRVAGGSVPVMDALGAEPVTDPMSAAYTNLEQGIVQGILSPTDVLDGFNLKEVTSYITKTPYLYNITFMKIMNQDTWNELPPEVQEILSEVNDEYTYEYGVLRAEHTRKGQENAVEEEGHEIIELDEEEEERWLERIKPVQQNWVEEKEEAGLPAEEILELVIDLDEKYSEEYGDREF